MINEMTGFDASCNSQANEDARSSDPKVSEPAIARLELAAKTIGPNLLEQKKLLETLCDSGAGPNNVVKVCAVCGSQDLEIHLNSVVVPLDLRIVNSVLRLDRLAVKKYINSRVTGYLNLTVLEFYALKHGVSLRVAFFDLYEKEGATDASFTKYCEDAEAEAAAVVAVAVAAAAAAEACGDDGSIVEEADPIILYIYPELVRFSTDQHVE